MASILDETDKICEDFVSAYIARQMNQIHDWLQQSVDYGTYDELMENKDDGPKFFSAPSFNENGDHLSYTYIRLIVKEDNLVYIKPLSDFPLRVVAFFDGGFPDFVRFDHPTKVRIHLLRDTRSNWKEDVEGETWFASDFYSETIRSRCLRGELPYY